MTVPGVCQSDILIAGGGIIGLSLALELHARGAQVTVLERDTAMSHASTAAAGMLAAEDPHNPLRGLKAALSVMGICGEAMTPPLRPISTRERETIAQFLQDVEQSTTAR